MSFVLNQLDKQVGHMLFCNYTTKQTLACAYRHIDNGKSGSSESVHGMSCMPDQTDVLLTVWLLSSRTQLCGSASHWLDQIFEETMHILPRAAFSKGITSARVQGTGPLSQSLILPSSSLHNASGQASHKGLFWDNLIALGSL
jgi:hypothetical protein